MRSTPGPPPRNRRPAAVLIRPRFVCYAASSLLGGVAMDLLQVERLIRDREVRVVKIGGADIDGVYRGKRVLTEQFLEGCRRAGFPQCDVIFGWDIAEQLIAQPFMSDLAAGTADTGFADIIMRT